MNSYIKSLGLLAVGSALLLPNIGYTQGLPSSPSQPPAQWSNSDDELLQILGNLVGESDPYQKGISAEYFCAASEVADQKNTGKIEFDCMQCVATLCDPRSLEEVLRGARMTPKQLADYNACVSVAKAACDRS